MRVYVIHNEIEYEVFGDLHTPAVYVVNREDDGEYLDFIYDAEFTDIHYFNDAGDVVNIDSGDTLYDRVVEGLNEAHKITVMEEF